MALIHLCLLFSFRCFGWARIASSRNFIPNSMSKSFAGRAPARLHNLFHTMWYASTRLVCSRAASFPPRSRSPIRRSFLFLYSPLFPPVLHFALVGQIQSGGLCKENQSQIGRASCRERV